MDLQKLYRKLMNNGRVERIEAKATGVYEMYYIELATGLRRGELLGLKWTDIDWKNDIIKVRRQVARVDGQIVEAPLKTKNSYRTVTISQQAIEVLKTQKEKTNDQYVFPVAVPGRNFAWRSRLVSRRPLPLARLLPPATGGSRLAPLPPRLAPSHRIV